MNDFNSRLRPAFLVFACALTVACESGSNSDTNAGSSGSNATDNPAASTSNNPPDGTDDDPLPTGDDDPGTDTGEPPRLAGECPLGERVGNFDVILEESYSAVDGEVREALVQTAILTVPAEEGVCRLVRRENPFCDPPCGGGDACTADAQCVEFPSRIEVGTVTITGLEGPAEMEPAADLRYFLTDLPHPAIAPGATIELTADGFSLDGDGFSALEHTTGDLMVAEGTPLDLTWTPEDGNAIARVEINIDQHGISPATLFCDAPDTGSFTVPASIIDALIESGTSGFPSANLYRQTIDSTDTATGCVEFRIRARTPATVVVDGHVPCTGAPGECPEGQTCNIPIQTCQ